MTNFQVRKVYEYVLNGTIEAQSIVVEGVFTCPGLGPDVVPVELRVISPTVQPPVNALASSSTSFTPGLVRLVVDAWEKTGIVGTEIKFEVHGNCNPTPFIAEDEWSDWEEFTAVVTPRFDTRTVVRKVDGDMHVLPASQQPLRRWYPATLDHLLYCVEQLTDPRTKAKLEGKAAGSHWGISSTAATGGQQIEFATPVHEPGGGDQEAGRLNKPLYEVVPDCLTPDALAFFVRTQGVPQYDPTSAVNLNHMYLFHVEAGIRIYELYSYIDGRDGVDFERDHHSLAVKVEQELASFGPTPPFKASNYFGPWALETMGGAGGQTIMGVASTATHGGDVKHSAIGELIVAMHLIAPDGQEYWIERTQLSPGSLPLKLIDENLLKQVYRPNDPKSPGGRFRRGEIKYLRDDNLMDAAIVACGRMGLVYSVVLRTMRQYALKQVTENEDWNSVKKWLCDPANPRHQQVFANRFVRIDVDLYPKPDFNWEDAIVAFALLGYTGPVGGVIGAILGLRGQEHRTWVITRTLGPLAEAVRIGPMGTPMFYGRAERGGVAAGTKKPLKVDMDDGGFTRPCGSANVVRQFLVDSIGDTKKVRAAAVATWLAAGAAMAFNPLAAAWAMPAQRFAVLMIVFADFWTSLFAELLDVLPAEIQFGDVLAAVANTLADLHAHAIFQVLYCIAQDSEHQEITPPLIGISYSVMDEHDYGNKGCVAPGDSIELFRNADDPAVVDFVDSVIAALRQLADDGEAFGGYLTMRFMAQSPSTLAMQRWPRTVSFEIAGLSRVSGTAKLLARIEEGSKARRMLLHWGQRNNRSQSDLEHVIPVAMDQWREALSTLSEHGRLSQLSTEFTRHKGLEITVPKVYGISASLTEGCATETTRVTFDGYKNPPEVQLWILQRFQDGRTEMHDVQGLAGIVAIPLGHGISTLELHARRELNGNVYEATPPIDCRVRGFATGDEWEFRFDAEKREVDGILRWYVEINLFSQFVSNQLRVIEVTLETSAAPDWVLRKTETGDIAFTGFTSTQPLPGQPLMNAKWRFFSKSAASGAVPDVRLRFKLLC